MPGQIRVLLADDVADLRMMVRVSLEVDGRFEVVGEAQDGIEAVNLAHSLRPDIVVLDISMPNMDGLEAIPEIHRVSPESRILVLSGFDERVGERAVGLCADEYMPKSEHIDSLPSRLLGVCASGPKGLGDATA